MSAFDDARPIPNPDGLFGMDGTWGPGYDEDTDGWEVSRETVDVGGWQIPGLSGGASWRQAAEDLYGHSPGHNIGFNAGAWEDASDPNDVETRLGLHGHVNTFDGAGKGGNASADAWIGSDGFSLGAGLTGIGAATSMPAFTAADDNETHAAGGLSWNMGLGLRGHWDDSDGDGARELGFGFDLGPLGFDVKSEAAWNFLTDLPELPFLPEPSEPEGLVPTAPDIDADSPFD